MNLTLKLILILFGLAYLISPVDIIPDLMLPFVGWIDDGLVLWCVYYLIRYGELPWFLFKRPGKRQKPTGPRVRSGNAGKAAAGETSHRDSGNTRAKTDQSQAKTDQSQTETASAHEILGVDRNASWKEIQKAYKEKIKQYHPDKLSHLGEEFSSLANEKFLQIQAAYNELKALHRKP